MGLLKSKSQKLKKMLIGAPTGDREVEMASDQHSRGDVIKHNIVDASKLDIDGINGAPFIGSAPLGRRATARRPNESTPGPRLESLPRIPRTSDYPRSRRNGVHFPSPRYGSQLSHRYSVHGHECHSREGSDLSDMASPAQNGGDPQTMPDPVVHSNGDSVDQGLGTVVHHERVEEVPQHIAIYSRNHADDSPATVIGSANGASSPSDPLTPANEQFTTRQLIENYAGGDPWVSAAKGYKLLMLGCQWHTVKADSTTDIPILRRRVNTAIAGSLHKIPDHDQPDFALDILLVWNSGKSQKYTTLNEDNLMESLQTLEDESRFSYLQVLPSGLMKVKTSVPRSPIKKKQHAEQVEAGASEVDPVRAGATDVEIPLDDMLKICWEAFLQE